MSDSETVHIDDLGDEGGERRAWRVSNQISVLLHAKSWSDGELAERSSISRSRVNRIKNGHIQPSVSDAIQISRALETPIEQIFQLERVSDALRVKN
jgi:transcriptional regulator with XRE-family HTH domain